MTCPRVLRLLLTALAAAGCATVPGASTNYTIEAVTQRGPYLDAVLGQGDTRIRFFFPAEEASCRQIIELENRVEYVSLGSLGMVRAGSETCDPVGVGSLDWWRRRRGRPEAPLNPTGTARFQPAYQDDEIAMVRGRFPLTGLVNWAGGFDTLAVLPQTGACKRLVERGEATIEFRASGRVPLRMLSSGESCPIDGLVQPIP